MNETILNRLEKFRSLMSQSNIQAVIIPQADPHQSEYLASHWQLRRYLSGFSGSAGTLVVTSDQALLWTDSRYFIQAAQQLEGTSIALMKDGLPDTPSIVDFLTSNLHPGDCVGLDGMLFSALSLEELTQKLQAAGIKINPKFDVADKIWPERPPLPQTPIFVHDELFSGKSAKDKIEEVLIEVKSQNAEASLVSALDEIAWILNIRCDDVLYNPVATSYLYLSDTDKILFIAPEKVMPEVEEYLTAQGVRHMHYYDVEGYIEQLPESLGVLVEKKSISSVLSNALADRAVFGHSPVAVLKACKNATQIEGIRSAMVRDGAAMVKAFMRLEELLEQDAPLSELSVSRLLLEYRSQQPLFFEESFGTISAYAKHGAIVHYEPDEESDAPLKREGLLLVDSGAQYLDCTTDITRTIALGTPTPAEKHDFTLVMKGHIALAQMVFPVGTYGVQLDAEARKFLWREGLGYLHGTGHGVGHFLNVHEGPHQIRMNFIPAVLKEGMITSNEPGLYRENIHGIRCENLMLCVKAMTTEFGEFLKFETLTLYPFDINLFETEIMTPEEIAWVNDYHRSVRDKLLPLLEPCEQEWLIKKTQPLKQS